MSEEYKSQRRRYWAIFTVSLVIAIAAASTFVAADRIKRSSGAVDPAIAILLTVVFVIGTVIANWMYLRSSDELVRANNSAAAFWGMAFLLISYPAWLILWMGQLVPEPNARGLYLMSCVAATIGYAWNRFR
jgi:predicted Na+-dependent transporter